MPRLAPVLLATTALSAAAMAETHHVDVGPGFDFVPASLTIQEGDTVVWTWVSGFHNVVSGVDEIPDGNFHSGDPVNDPGLTFEVTFDSAFLKANPMPDNIYSYYCEVHFNFGMTGTVTVEEVEPECPADIADADGDVNVNDLLALLANWGTAGAGSNIAEPANVVDVNDLLGLLGAWGSCG